VVRADRKVLGKRMDEHLRFAVCYWHSFASDGRDPFRRGTFERPGTRRAATRCSRRAQGRRRLRAAARCVHAPFFTFHDLDIAPEGRRCARRT
jgi:xylose isomerase